jgi:dipeptidyl aminopeptidase/acylaminoacyl peptidase
VTAAVAWYPPTDLAHMDEQRTVPGSMPHGDSDSPESLLVGEPVSSGSAAVRFASPIEHVSKTSAPLLLVHGELDRAVPAGQSSALADRLTECGAEVELEIIAGADHVFEGVDRTPIIERSVSFLSRHLKAS